jgi:hypothetical protein
VDDLAQAPELQQGDGAEGELTRRCGNVIGPTHRDGRVGTIGEADDEVGIGPPADADHLDLLAGEGMMGMRDRHL